MMMIEYWTAEGMGWELSMCLLATVHYAEPLRLLVCISVWSRRIEDADDGLSYPPQYLLLWEQRQT